MSVPATVFTPARVLPNGEYFYSPLGLFGFQADGVAEAYMRTNPGEQSGVLAIYSTGLGKTIVGIALAAMLFEDDEIDYVMVVCERNKLGDWREEFETRSVFATHLYHGTGRQKRLAKNPHHHVFITSYETGRAELMVRESTGRRGKGARVDGPLVATLGLHGKRTLWIFDEITKLRGRSSELHQAYDYLLHTLRREPAHQRVLGLTATPMERDFEDSYNIGRIVCPEQMPPTVESFENTFTRGVDDYGRYIFRWDRKEQFGHLFQDIVMYKRKTDADVVAQFPKQIEQSIFVPQGTDFAALYESIAELYDISAALDTRTAAQQEVDERRLYTALRMTAGHPASHLHASNELSQAIVGTLGESSLRAIKSPKSEELITRLKPLVKGQGAKAVIFTFFARTVLPELVADLRAAGFSVAEFHGGRSTRANEDAKLRFIAGRVELLVCSDAAAKGLNLGNAEYVFEFESALTYAMRTQRINRVHRINSAHPLVTCYTMILEGTVEEGIINKVLDRNRDQDILLGDEDDGTDFISAAVRRELLKISRKRRT